MNQAEETNLGYHENIRETKIIVHAQPQQNKKKSRSFFITKISFYGLTLI